MLAHHYAEALIRAKGKDVSKKFLALLEKRGHRSLLPAIVSEYEKCVETGQRTNQVTLRVARKEDVVNSKKQLATYKKKLLFDLKQIQIVEDSSLVGGFVLEKGEYEVDGSYRSKLLELYRHLMSISV